MHLTRSDLPNLARIKFSWMVNNGKHSRVIIFTRGKPNKVVRALTIDRKECNRNNLVLFMFYLYSIELPRTFFSHTTLISIDSIELTKMSRHRCRDCWLENWFWHVGNLVVPSVAKKRKTRSRENKRDFSQFSPWNIPFVCFSKATIHFLYYTHARDSHTGDPIESEGA